MSDDKIYTLEQAAEALSANVQILRKKIKEGEIKAYKRLRKWYILHSDLVAYIKGGETDGKDGNED